MIDFKQEIKSHNSLGFTQQLRLEHEAEGAAGLELILFIEVLSKLLEASVEGHVGDIVFVQYLQ